MEECFPHCTQQTSGVSSVRLITPSHTNTHTHLPQIAKNMERWAKSVNAAKSAQKQQVNMLTQQSKPLAKPSTSKSIPSVGIAVGNTVPQVGGVSNIQCV